MKIVNRNPYELREAEYNPRELTKAQFNSLSDSLKRFGFVDPLIVNVNDDRKNILIGGHQRLKIAKELGIEKVPCVEIDLEYSRERELNIRLNKNVGQWDYDALANFFDVGELTEWGFSESELLWQGNYEPNFEGRNVTGQEVDAEQGKRDEHFKEIYKLNIEKMDLICPNCAHEFQINETR